MPFPEVLAMTTINSQTTDFSRDVLGRFICNGLDEALASTQRIDARPFDIIVIGGGSFGSVLAQRLFTRDKSHAHRILVLEGGPFALSEHVQNYPLLGLDPAGATSIADLRAIGQDKVPRNEVWGLAWHGNQKFPGLAYCVGGRSVFWGGWSPQPLDQEIASWPAAVRSDLNTAGAEDPYYKQSAELIGVIETNDFIHGTLHEALRERLKEGIDANKVSDALPLAGLPDHPGIRWGEATSAADVFTLLGARVQDVAAAVVAPQPMPGTPLSAQLAALNPIPVGGAVVGGGDLLNLLKLEAPLAVETRTRSGFFPWNKFSAIPLLTKAVRASYAESANDDVKKRLMIVPCCHVKRLRTVGGRVQEVETNLGNVPVPPNGTVIIALGTIESTRLALNSFVDPPSGPQTAEFGAWRATIGRNLMAHLRSNLTIRFPRTALPIDPAIKELQASALFVKGAHQQADGTIGHFHFQITAAGLGSTDADSEAELFKKVPDIETFDRFKAVTDSHIVVTIRGIGEMEPNNPVSGVFIDSESDEFGIPRANVTLQASANDQALWNAMDKAADDVAKVLSGGGHEVLSKTRDGLGTTHHEGGTLALGSVTDDDGRFIFVDNAYALGPALFPRLGSPNPMLTGVALARRMAAHLVPAPTPFAPVDGFTPLFDGFRTDNWRFVGKGGFRIVDGAFESMPGGDDLGLNWCETPMPPNFILKLEWLRWQQDDNSGVFVRFPDPTTKGYNNQAWVAVNFGFEVQIDENGAPDGDPIHKTGAIYGQAGQARNVVPAKPVSQWNEFEIRIQGQNYTVLLNGTQVTQFTNTDAARGLPSTAAAPSFIGLQSYAGKRVAFRNIRYKAI
jgi:choline dehydrogenase-like flavoprotein